MNKVAKYPEIDPTLSAVKILQQQFKSEKACIAAYFMPASEANAQAYISAFGKTWQRNLKPDEKKHFPSREDFLHKISIRNIRNTPNLIQHEFKPQMGLLMDNTPGESVVIIQMFNQFDSLWDYIYILADKNLIQSIQSKIKAAGFETSKADNWQSLVKSYFLMLYPFMGSISENEKNKLVYTKDLIGTLEQSIVYNQQLQTEISILKQKKEKNLVDEMRLLASEEALKAGKNVEISQNAIDYILQFKGPEKKLKDAFLKAVGIANLIATAKNEHTLLIKPEYIQVNEGPEELKSTRLNPKRVERAEYILQRYEEATQRAQNVGKKITINSIAQHVLPKSISAPAVSDSISKYKTEIMYLLDTRSADWILLRTYFGPVSSLAKRATRQPHA